MRFFYLIFNPKLERMLSAVLMNEVTEARLSKHSKIKGGWRNVNEWCAANTLDSIASARDCFFYPTAKHITNTIANKRGMNKKSIEIKNPRCSIKITVEPKIITK